MNPEQSYNRLMAALTTVVLIRLPLVLIAIPRFTRDEFPGPLTRVDAVIGFFIAVPLGFILITAYQVARYHGIIGGAEDAF